MLSEKDILKLAELSRLTLTEEELKNFPQEMERMVEFAGRIAELEVGGEVFDGISTGCNGFREDKAGESWPANEILKNAANSDGSFFRVPRRRNY